MVVHYSDEPKCNFQFKLFLNYFGAGLYWSLTSWLTLWEAVNSGTDKVSLTGQRGTGGVVWSFYHL